MAIIGNFTKQEDGSFSGTSIPLYRTETCKWMQKPSGHKRCVALVFAHTDNKGFLGHVFAEAKAIYFQNGRVKFRREDDSCPKNGPAAPSCLVMHTEQDIKAVLSSGLLGSLMGPA
jgi:hypothetical protein